MTAKRYEMLQSCVSLRNILVKLNAGEKVTVIPERQLHKDLEQTCLLLESEMLRQRKMAMPKRKGVRRPAKEIAPYSLKVRKSREKLQKNINQLVDKYFQVHGKPKAVKQDRKRSLLKQPQYVSEVQQ